MTTNETRTAIAAAISRRYDDMPAIIWPARTADRTRNGQRGPRYARRRTIR